MRRLSSRFAGIAMLRIARSIWRCSLRGTCSINGRATASLEELMFTRTPVPQASQWPSRVATATRDHAAAFAGRAHTALLSWNCMARTSEAITSPRTSTLTLRGVWGLSWGGEASCGGGVGLSCS